MSRYSSSKEPTRRNVFALSGIAGVAAASASAAPTASADDVTHRTDSIHNILEFGDAGLTDEQRLLLAIKYFVSNKVEATLIISRGFRINATVEIDIAYISIEMTGANINSSAVPNGPALRFFSSAPAGGTQARTTYRGLRLIGPGKTSLGSSALQFDSSVGDVAGIGFFGLEVYGYHTGLEFKNRGSGISFFAFHLYGCATGVALRSGFADSGDDIRFIGGGIGTSDTAVLVTNSDAEVHFHSTSFDWCKQTIKAEDGSVSLSQCHFEMSSASAQSGLPPFYSGASPNAKITIVGGDLIYLTPATTAHLFETASTSWSGGISVNSLSMMNTTTTSGYLVGGTANVKFDNMMLVDGNGSGSGAGAVLTHKSANKLIDGTFNLPTPVDVFSISSDATSRTDSPGLALTTSGGRLVLTRNAAKPWAAIAIDVPCTAGKFYASEITFAGGTAGGTFTYIECFVANQGFTRTTTPVTLKTNARGTTNISMTDVKSVASFKKTFGATSWSRIAPPWATHFRIKMGLNSVTGGTINVAEIIVTEL
ncbi:hypothetical protein SAMN06295885_1015 [Rathayibacter oskolensis]|uniref:Right handed beta helix region n=1 Tax=Rathayibacter oskolensis TaxID=1891671 RepID=A0A1X7NCL7_9MICO|nr:hypothetical protein [Rathayibacter oskolensis]SMH34629.1 hypothetical protein SAMN06295885_1015 [Rathayibacter oskolensis]